MSTTTEQTAFTADWASWHAQREATLAEPHGWLSLAGLHWIDDTARAYPHLPGTWRATAEGAVEVTATAADGVGRRGEGGHTGERGAGGRLRVAHPQGAVVLAGEHLDLPLPHPDEHPRAAVDGVDRGGAVDREAVDGDRVAHRRGDLDGALGRGAPRPGEVRVGPRRVVDPVQPREGEPPVRLGEGHLPLRVPGGPVGGECGLLGRRAHGPQRASCDDIPP